jgi:hypothetical protein
MDIKIKTITQVSKDDFIDDNLCNFRNDGSSTYSLRDSYKRIEKFLKENAETLSPQDIKPFGSYFGEGIITPPSANSTYFLGNCLVENDWHPLFSFVLNRIGHGIKIAGAISNMDAVYLLIIKNLDSWSGYNEKEQVYQTSLDIDFRAFSCVSELEKFLKENGK